MTVVVQRYPEYEGIAEMLEIPTDKIKFALDAFDDNGEARGMEADDTAVSLIDTVTSPAYRQDHGLDASVGLCFEVNHALGQGVC